MDVLETVNVLFTQSPYIVILAIDDNIIVKAVDRNLNQRAQLEINGRDYLRNMIHLPFYMQDQPWVSMIYRVFTLVIRPYVGSLEKTCPKPCYSRLNY